MHPSLVVEYVNEFSDELVQYMAENLSPRVSYLLHKKLREMALPWRLEPGRPNYRTECYKRMDIQQEKVLARVVLQSEGTWGAFTDQFWFDHYPTKEEAMSNCDERLLGHDIVLLTEEDMR